MTFDEARKIILSEAERDYVSFNLRITPTEYPMLGVRIPRLRKLAKELTREYLDSDPYYFEEVVLHGLVLGTIKESDELFAEVDRFLSFVDNWAAIDVPVSSMTAFKKDKAACYEYVKKLLFDEREFYARFGAVALLDHYIDEEHVDEVLGLYSQVKEGRYYVDMAVAWGLSVAAVRFFDKTMKMIESDAYGPAVRRKALSKCMDSYRLNEEQKDRIRKLRQSK